MQTKNVSVIIPIYNVEKYLSRCLDSIIDQTYLNLEILLINDGSTDMSGEICEEYEKKDSRIKVFHIKNAGANNARKLGLAKSSGYYICFVDSDDYLPQDSISTLLSYSTDDIDIVIGRYMKVIFNGKQKPYHPLEQLVSILDQQQYIKRILLRMLPIGPCGKLYKRCLFDESVFYDIKVNEDLLMNLAIAVKSNKTLIVDKVVYYYCSRRDSQTFLFRGTVDSEKKVIQLVQHILLDNNLQKLYQEEYIHFSLRKFYGLIAIYGRLIKTNDEQINEILRNINLSQLSLKEYVIFWALKVMVLQKMIYIFRILYRKTIVR